MGKINYFQQKVLGNLDECLHTKGKVEVCHTLSEKDHLHRRKHWARNSSLTQTTLIIFFLLP